MRPPAHEAEELEEERDEQPEQDAAPQASDRRHEPDPATAEEREEVDRRDEERQQRGDEHDLDRPAADDPRAEPDVRRRPLRQLEPFVERREQLLRRAPDLAEPRPALRRADKPGRVADLARRTVAGRGERQRRDAAPEERRLLVRAEGKREIEQLSQRARASGRRRLPARARAPLPWRGARRSEPATCHLRTRAASDRARRSRRGRRPRPRHARAASAPRSEPRRRRRGRRRPSTGTRACAPASRGVRSTASSKPPRDSRTTGPARSAQPCPRRCRSHRIRRRCCHDGRQT